MPRSGPSQQQYRDDTWEGYNASDDITPQNRPYDYNYRDDQSGWVPGPGPYYEPTVSKQSFFKESFGTYVIPVRSWLRTTLYGRPYGAFI
jgi:hypothetical protein